MKRQWEWSQSRRSSPRLAVGLEECYLLTRQLSVLQRVGVPLLSSLEALQAQLPPSGPASAMLRDVRQDLLAGKAFSQALQRHPGVFGPVFIGLIRVGEAGGLLEEVLRQLAQLLEWEIELRNRIRAALQYPVVVLGVLTLAVTIVLVFVVPRFENLFRSFEVPLPLPTRLLLGVSWCVSHYGWAMGLAAAGLGVGVWRFLRTAAGRFWWHRWQLRLPVVGPLFLQLALSRFARLVAALNHSGVPMVETLALAGESVNNTYVQQRIARVCDRVKGGESLAEALGVDRLFPPVLVQMVASGEATGRVDELLQGLSEYYDQQFDYAVRRLILLIEPALLIVVGVGVLLMAMGVLLPMWSLVRVVR